MKSKAKCLRLVYVLIACASLTGCGSAGRAPVASTTGIVTLDGVPVEGVKVSFLPSESSSIFSHGTTDKDGKFTMSTYGLDDGALVGKHKVSVSKVDLSEAKFDANELKDGGYGGGNYQQMMGVGGVKRQENKNLLPKKYSDINTSGIEITIEAGITNDVPLKLKKQ